MKSNERNNQNGFTLLETMIALFIFATALVSLTAVAGRGVLATRTAQQSTVAHYLAQEGMELVTNKRDTNYLELKDWLADMGACKTPEGCQVDATKSMADLQFTQCSGIGCGPLLRSPSIGLYNYETQDATAYVRTIRFLETSIPNFAETEQIQVVSKVEWEVGDITRSAEVTKILTSWFN